MDGVGDVPHRSVCTSSNKVVYLVLYQGAHNLWDLRRQQELQKACGFLLMLQEILHNRMTLCITLGLTWPNPKLQIEILFACKES